MWGKRCKGQRSRKDEAPRMDTNGGETKGSQKVFKHSCSLTRNNTDSLICRLVGNLYRRDLGAGAMRGVGARQLHWAELAERDTLKRSAHVRPAVRGSGRGQERRQSGSLHGRNVSECGRGFSLKIHT